MSLCVPLSCACVHGILLPLLKRLVSIDGRLPPVHTGLRSAPCPGAWRRPLPRCCCVEAKAPHEGTGGRSENRGRLSSARKEPRGVPLCVRRGRILQRKGDAYGSLSWEGIPSVLRAHRL